MGSTIKKKGDKELRIPGALFGQLRIKSVGSGTYIALISYLGAGQIFMNIPQLVLGLLETAGHTNV